MEKLKIAMMSMTHGHTRKYYDVLQHNPKLSFVAVSTENETARETFCALCRVCLAITVMRKC